MKDDKITDEVKNKVKAYVYENYKSYVGKELIITENDACFMVFKHINGSPLILGKGIV